jgi:hypothetical protein
MFVRSSTSDPRLARGPRPPSFKKGCFTRDAKSSVKPTGRGADDERAAKQQQQLGWRGPLAGRPWNPWRTSALTLAWHLDQGLDPLALAALAKLKADAETLTDEEWDAKYDRAPRGRRLH